LSSLPFSRVAPLGPFSVVFTSTLVCLSLTMAISRPVSRTVRVGSWTRFRLLPHLSPAPKFALEDLTRPNPPTFFPHRWYGPLFFLPPGGSPALLGGQLQLPTSQAVLNSSKIIAMSFRQLQLSALSYGYMDQTSVRGPAASDRLGPILDGSFSPAAILELWTTFRSDTEDPGAAVPYPHRLSRKTLRPSSPLPRFLLTALSALRRLPKLHRPFSAHQTLRSEKSYVFFKFATAMGSLPPPCKDLSLDF